VVDTGNQHGTQAGAGAAGQDAPVRAAPDRPDLPVLTNWPALTDPGLRPRHPVIILAGNFGSGKTELACNLCLGLAAAGERVRLADLDIVKPLFRCREAMGILEAAGVHLVVPRGERFWADLPIVLPEVKGMIQQPDGFVVLDVGGEATGARVLASLGDAFQPDSYEFWLVVNTCRPFTTQVPGLQAMCEQVGQAAGLKPTGLIANTHLLDETDVELVVEGYDAARELESRLGVPVRMVACMESLVAGLPRDRFDCPVLPLRRLPGMSGNEDIRLAPPFKV
jgi:hypothetical protein